MDRRKSLNQFVNRAKRRLNIEKMVPAIQYGLLFALILCASILFVSRLFVFPYYDNVAVMTVVVVLMGTIFFIWWKRVKEKEALICLDAFYPHNELVTALSLKDKSNPLIETIVEKAETDAPKSFERFKMRKKDVWKPKILVGIMLTSIVIGVLSIFPSSTQQEALVIEKEKSIINDLQKEVAKMEKKAKTEEVKKQVQELQNKLKEVETSEEALREVVKKQKELKLQEQKLKEKEDLAKQDGAEGTDGLTAEQQEQLKELMEMQSALAKNANSTQSALSKVGKPISFDLQNAIASETELKSTGKNSDQTNASKSGKSQNQNSNQSGKQQQGQGKGTGQGQGNNGSSGQGQGQGTGNGQGNSRGGQGSGLGSGAGLGQGSRDLLSVPKRIGGSSKTEVDSGLLGQGTGAGEQKGEVPVTKGTIRPYEEVIGQYKDSYLESSDRMQLPKDLQNIVQDYFTSIESN